MTMTKKPSRIQAALRGAVLLPALAAAAGVMARTAPHAHAPAWTSSKRLWAPADLDLTVVLPSYNTGPALTTTVDSLARMLQQAGGHFEIIVVSDGSTDGCEDEIEAVDPRVRLIHAPENAGKGAALHRGFAAARGRHIAFVDSDGDIAVEHVVRYWRRAVAGDHHVVYADKRHDSSRVESTRVRKTLSWGFTTLVGSFFDLPVADTQTGCKVFRRDVLASVLPLLHERGFSIDLELFVAAHAIGFHDFVGAPVHIGERLAGSSVGRSAVVRTLRESLSVLGRQRFGHAYGRVPVVPMAVVHEFPAPRNAGHLAVAPLPMAA